MKIIEKIAKKAKDYEKADIPVIAFLGDSVTQGCFEIYKTGEKSLETVFDAECAYHNYLAKILRMLYPSAPVTIINAGISGGNACGGFERLKKDVLKFSPDLVVVCFGLNDSTNGIEGIEKYRNALKNIFNELKASGCEVIFMTANMNNTYVSHKIDDEFISSIAKMTMEIENNDILKKYFEAAKEVAEECGVVVCDVYSKWRTLAANGVDTTALLANDINHPTREMNKLFAYSLIETMFEN